MLVQTWREAYLLWDAKDWSMDALALEIKEQIASGKRPALATLTANGRRLSLSESSIQRMASTDERIPEVLAELVEELKAQNPGAEAKTRIVEEGLRVVRGQPSQRDARELALALLAQFPTSDLALRLADALLAQAQAASGNGSLLDVFAQAIAGRLPHVPKLNTAKLARIIAKRIAKKLPSLTFARLAFVAGVASIVACGAWFLLDRAHRPAPPHMALSVYVSAGSAPVFFDAGAFLGATDMGEKPLDQPIPSGPLPGQKAPPCDSGLYEEGINGGCWMQAVGAKPPCGRLFKSGDKCYRPIAEDPKKPVGSDANPAPAR